MILERKRVWTIEDYVKFIQGWFGSNWDLSQESLKEMKERHGVPSSYPAIVWCERTYDPEATWGSGYSNKIHIIDEENLEIKRQD